jgi:tetratricopeptide (TPR) repeat protein
MQNAKCSTWWLLVFCLLLSPFCIAQPRMASDFEIAQMEKQLATSHDFLAQLSGRLNLGDLRLTRNETSLARSEYTKALDIAAKGRVDARRASELGRYATATAYAGLAQAKLGNAARAFALLEEATRYSSGESRTWNLYATAMALLGKTAKATSAARNALSIAEEEVRAAPATANRLDLAIYRYSLATNLGDTSESERLLTAAIADLQSPAFDDLRRDVARKESFEIYSSARGEEASYLAALNRAQLRLAALYEGRGELVKARAMNQSVLRSRSDDPTALAAIARLTRSESDYAAAFDANPFSMPLIRDYQHYLTTTHTTAPDEDTPGAQMRRALQQLARGDGRAVAALLKKYPDNDAVSTIAAEGQRASDAPAAAWLRGDATTATPTAAELRVLLSRQLSAEERRALDRVLLTAIVTFEPSNSPAPNGQTIFETGSIGDVKIRFAEPTAFTGAFGTTARLTFRILGVANDALLVEPVRLEPAR